MPPRRGARGARAAPSSSPSRPPPAHLAERLARGAERLHGDARVLVQRAVQAHGVPGGDAQRLEAQRVHHLQVRGDVGGGAHALHHTLELRVRHHRGRASVRVRLRGVRQPRARVLGRRVLDVLAEAHVQRALQVLVVVVEFSHRRTHLTGEKNGGGERVSGRFGLREPSPETSSRRGDLRGGVCDDRRPFEGNVAACSRLGRAVLAAGRDSPGIPLGFDRDTCCRRSHGTHLRETSRALLLGHLDRHPIAAPNAPRARQARTGRHPAGHPRCDGPGAGMPNTASPPGGRIRKSQTWEVWVVPRR